MNIKSGAVRVIKQSKRNSQQKAKNMEFGYPENNYYFEDEK